MERKEAIEVVKKNYPHCAESGTQFETALRTLIPELKDERIRQKLLFLCYAWRNKEQVEIPNKEEVDETIAWLEKQESVGEIVERCKNSWYNEGKIAGQFEGITDDEKYQQGWHDALEKQGEQKPVELSDNEKNLVDIVTERMLEEGPIPELKGKEKADFEKEFNRFKQITGMINWPAREEIYKKVILWFIAWAKDHLSIGTIKNDSEMDKPVGWSEEDEKAINDIMWIIEAYRKNGFNETHIQMADNSEKWLNSLSPKAQWKPSEEQMNDLMYIIERAVEDDSLLKKNLSSLYNDLKKLKGE